VHDRLKETFVRELNLGRMHYHKQEYSKSFYYLERAHILGQKNIVAHLKIHIWMLKVAIKQEDLKELIGQLIRIPLAVIGSAIGIVPIGNTGGSNVHIFKRMKVPEDLEGFLEN
jgi:hypothetical protein